MDRMDGIDRMRVAEPKEEYAASPWRYRHGELTERILGACFDVANELGAGFVESVYEKALLIALRDRSLDARAQVPLEVRFRGEVVGEFRPDILVESKVIVELKACGSLLAEHQAQVINYLKATGIDVGLLVDFGKPKVQWRRLYR